MAQAPLATAPSNPIAAFLWGSNGQQLTPAQAAAKQRIAEALIGQMSTPKNVGEGLSSVAHAIMAKDMMNQAQDAQKAGTDQSSADFQGLKADPSKAADFIADDPFATPGQLAVAQAMMAQQFALTNPDTIANRALLQSEINKNNAESGLPVGDAGGSTGGVGFPGADAAAGEKRLLLNGDPSSQAYAVAYEDQYGPKTISVPGLDGAPVIQTIQQPIPASIRKPTYAPTPPPPTDPTAPQATSAPVVDPAVAGPSDTTTVNTVGGGSVTQQGAQVNKQVYNSNRAMTVAAPALKSLHTVMGSLGDPQNRIALQTGEWGKFLASDDGKKALDSINAIANTVASAQNIDPKSVREELTPLSTDTPAMRRYRLDRADEYVQGLASGNDTAGAKAAVKDAIATPSDGNGAIPPDGYKVKDAQGNLYVYQGGKPVPVQGP